MKGKRMTFDPNHPVAIETAAKLKVVNRLNRQHYFASDDYWGGGWTPGVDKPYDSFLVAKFVGGLEQGGRLYTKGYRGYQRMRAIERPTLRIDNVPCTEIDFRSMGPNIAYNLCGLPCRRDVYDFLGKGKDARIVAKQVLTSMLGAKNRVSAMRSFNFAMRGDKIGLAKRAKAAKLKSAWRALGRPSAKTLFSEAMRAHRAIAGFFYADRSLELQRIESAIALDILYDLAVQGIPAAGIHDSFCVQEQHRGALLKIMESAYQRRLGFPPLVKCAF